MTLEQWETRRTRALWVCVGKMTMIGKLLDNGVYTAQDGAREIRNADAELTRECEAINAQWDAEKEQAS